MALLYACGESAGPDSVPAIVVSPANATFQATANGANPASAAIAITNGGSGTLGTLSTSTAYSGGQPTGWLTATLSGTTAPSTLTLTAATGALSAGTYNATVTIAAPAAGNTPQAVAVTFIVGLAPAIAAQVPDTVYVFSFAGSLPGPFNVAITNSGGGTLDQLSVNVTFAASQPQGWLIATLQGAAAPTTLVVVLPTASLSHGTYSATVTVSSPQAANTARFTVLLRVL